jgi:hypothetical protein
MLTTQYARALPGVRVNAADPSYTATDFNGHTGHQTVTEGTDAIVTLATESTTRAVLRQCILTAHIESTGSCATHILERRI